MKSSEHRVKSAGISVASQASLNSKGTEKRLEKASPWARSVLGRLGRLLWMEDAEGSPKAGGVDFHQNQIRKELWNTYSFNH